MKRPLKVGDICIGVGFVIDTKRNKLECTITKSLGVRTGICTDGTLETGVCFEVVWEDGDACFVSPVNLKLKPPKDDSLTWAEGKVTDLFKPIKQLEPV